MREHIVRIRALDSLLFRDGRPFANEPGALTARSLPIPPPNTVAGFLRSLIGNLKGVDWAEIDAKRIFSEPEVRGPLPMRGDEFVLPAPADALVLPAQSEGAPPRVLPLLPELTLGDGEGCDLPDYYYGLRPLPPPRSEKPEKGYAFWRWDELRQWLEGETPSPLTKIEPPPVDRRTHVAIDPSKGVADEGNLFTVEYRAYEERTEQPGESPVEWSLVAQVRTEYAGVIGGVAPFGGERRLASVEPYDRWLTCPDSLREKLREARYVRMYLATPAQFTCGWRPGWLRKENQSASPRLVGTPPDLDGLTLRLVAAAVPRRTAVSGWNMRKSQFGPRPVRWCVPAGAVYFFEVLGATPASSPTRAGCTPSATASNRTDARTTATDPDKQASGLRSGASGTKRWRQPMNETRLILLHALTPLHVGTGQAVGNVDLPIAREKATGFPIVPASALKGVLRDNFNNQSWATQAFGDTDQAGAWVFTDLRILCLPVRSFFGCVRLRNLPADSGATTQARRGVRHHGLREPQRRRERHPDCAHPRQRTAQGR
jgi:CRISPR-associated protein Cmr3